MEAASFPLSRACPPKLEERRRREKEGVRGLNSTSVRRTLFSRS
jgi:hypothetical protein